MMARPTHTANEGSIHKTLGQLLPGVALSEECADIEPAAITADSRQVTPGALFLAFPGLSADGRDYMQQAVDAGAAAVFAERDGWVAIELAVPVVTVSQLAEKASGIAGRFYGEPSKAMRVTGITGTNAKTTCSQLLAQLLHLLGEPAAVVGTLGYGLAGQKLVETGMTTPDAISTQQLLADLYSGGASQLCMEVSSHSLDQGRVNAVQYHTAVFTNLSRDHLDYHGDMESYAAAKAKLFSRPELQLAVLNGDDPACDRMAAVLPAAAQCYRYGIANTEADVVASDLELTESGICAQLKTPWGSGVLRSSLLAEFNVSNLLAVITAACGQGWPLDDVLAVVPQLQAVDGRMQQVNTPPLRPVVVVDYAHTPDALEQALSALHRHCGGRLWCVFGCGGDRDKGKRSQMGEIAARLSDCPVVTSDNPRSESPDSIIVDVLAGMPDTMAVRVAPDRAAAIREAIACADDEDWVLIAGKGHEQYQEVDGEKIPFSDVAEAHQVLLDRAAGQNGEAGDGYAH